MRKIFLLLILLSFGCFKPVKVNTAFNWSKTHYSNATGAVAVTINKKRPYCSGVLIKPNIVLTAGHCLDDFRAKRMYITYKCNHILQSSCKHVRVKLKVFNPGFDYTPGLWNDLGILITEKDITDMQPAKIGSFSDIKKLQEYKGNLVTAGFGRRPNRDVGILYMGLTSIREHYMYEFLTQDNGFNGPCKGDSGGPAYYQAPDGELRVVGILSRNQRTRVKCGGKAKYTIPILYMDWVEEISSIINILYGKKL